MNPIFKLFIPAMALVFVSGCGESKNNIDIAALCKTDFMGEHKMEVGGTKKVDLDAPSTPVNAANLTLSSTEIFIHDTERDIRARIIVKPNAEDNAEAVCFGGKGIRDGMEDFKVSVPIVTAMNIEKSGKITHSSENIIIELLDVPGRRFFTSKTSGKSGAQDSMKKLYDSFTDLQQFYFFGSDKTQLRNRMKGTVASARNSSGSAVEIRTTQVLRTLTE